MPKNNTSNKKKANTKKRWEKPNLVVDKSLEVKGLAWPGSNAN